MEILDYLQVARRRLWLLILIPLIATAAAVAYVLVSPPTYSASVIVSSSSLVGTPWSQFTGPQAVSQFAGAFSASAHDPVALDAASKQVHISSGDLADGVAVQQVGASSNMSLVYTGTTKKLVVPAARAIAVQALDRMFTPQMSIAKQEADNAATTVAVANAAIAELGAKYNTPDPSAAYAGAMQQLIWLQQQQANLRATGKSADAAALDSAVGTQKKQMQTLAPLLPHVSDLKATAASAEASLSTAREDYRRGQAALSAAGSPSVMSVGSVQAGNRILDGARLVLPVLGAAIFLAVLVVMILELLAGARSARAVRTASPEATVSPSSARRTARTISSAERDGAGRSPVPESAAQRSG